MGLGFRLGSREDWGRRGCPLRGLIQLKIFLRDAIFGEKRAKKFVAVLSHPRGSTYPDTFDPVSLSLLIRDTIKYLPTWFVRDGFGGDFLARFSINLTYCNLDRQSGVLVVWFRPTESPDKICHVSQPTCPKQGFY